MSDRDLWRKNLPEDFEGRMGKNWDDEVDIGVIVKSTVAIAVTVAIAFVFCWFLLGGLEGLREKPTLSPIAEANDRRLLLPPDPMLQPSPELEMDAMLEEMAEHMGSYGWIDELDQRVHMPVDRAMEVVLERRGSLPSIEPAVEPAVDMQLDGTPSADGGDGETDA